MCYLNNSYVVTTTGFC